jgi:cation diffusion facilitator CzcD-associated flavoprotein CzcO
MDFRESFFDCVFDIESPMHKFFEDMSKSHLATQLPGDKYADIREKLQPHYEVGCKRVIITDDYFPTFTKENVTLETSPILEVTQNGVTTEAGAQDFDLLVLATGFKTTQFMYPIKIYGTNGKSIEDVWSSGASAYLGMTIPELPNFGMLYGKPFHIF